MHYISQYGSRALYFDAVAEYKEIAESNKMFVISVANLSFYNVEDKEELEEQQSELRSKCDASKTKVNLISKAPFGENDVIVSGSLMCKTIIIDF